MVSKKETRMFCARNFKEAVQRCSQKVSQRQRGVGQRYITLRNGQFDTPEELRRVFPSLDNFKYRDKWWVIDIGGNNLRLIAFIEFRDNRMYVKHICSHAEYDRLTEKYRRYRE